MKKISKQQVLLLHLQLIAQSGGSSGLGDEGLLEAALEAPFQEFAGISNYSCIEEKAARLGYGIIQNHPFIDGNKRIGAHVMMVLLYINGIQLMYRQEELIEIILAVAAGNAGYTALLQWVKQHEQ